MDVLIRNTINREYLSAISGNTYVFDKKADKAIKFSPEMAQLFQKQFNSEGSNKVECVDWSDINLSPTKELAIFLHSSCRHNHTDGCGFYYEISNNEHNWSGYAHADYLRKAEKLISEFPKLSINEIKNMVTAVKKAL